MSALDFTDLEVGDVFRMPSENVYGEITDMICDDDGDPLVLVVHNHDGRWATVDLNACVRLGTPQLQ